MKIVGVTGSIGSGKTTFAEFLAENAGRSKHFESWQLIAEVANELRAASSKHPDSHELERINAWLQPLPLIIEKVCHKQVEFEQIRLTSNRLQETPDAYTKLFEYLNLVADRPELRTGDITKSSKEAFRSLLQWLGGYFEKNVASGTWYDEIVRRIESADNIDLATVGGVRFVGDAERIAQAGGKIMRIERPSISVQDANEVTERERNLIVVNATVVNDADLPALRNVANRVWKDLQGDRLIDSYITSQTQA